MPPTEPDRAAADTEERRHDFKNQLAIICGFTEILLDGTADDDPRRRDLEEIQTAALTALRLLARLYPPTEAVQSQPS
jgi:hypothetical protein